MLEGAGFELRWALESIASAGMPVDHLWLIGGAARSPVWPNILCNITGIPISTTQYKHGPALGVAIIAGMKVDAYQSIEDGRSRFTISANHIQPEPVQVELYNRLYKSYRKTAALLRDISMNNSTQNGNRSLNLKTIKGIVLDIDGTLLRGSEPLPGLIGFFEFLRQNKIAFIVGSN